MDSRTGEIINNEKFKELLLKSPEEAQHFFEIDNKPDPNCKACEGNGFIGYFENGKIIPCPCVFDSHGPWAEAIVRQRDLGRANVDKGLNIIRKRKGNENG